MRTSIHHHRNGITLLFVVSMIVLFLLMGTAFVVLAGDFYRSSRVRAYKEIHVDEGSALVEQAIYQLIREPDLDSQSNPLRCNGLLSDMYGYGIKADVNQARWDSNQQFIQVALNNPTYLSNRSPVSNVSDFEWSGQVLTLIPGIVVGRSGQTEGTESGFRFTTRIVKHEIVGSSHNLTLLPESRQDYGDLDDFKEAIINGRPFTGAGAKLAQPNQFGRPRTNLTTSVHEPFDAFTDPTNENIFLGGVNPNGTIEHSSFYRAGIAGFAALSDNNQTGDARFRIVDNRNSGQPDGIWMDIGLPDRIGVDGAVYRPLVSYLVVDMDGRLNVNFHGNEFETAATRQMTDHAFFGNPAAPLNRGTGFGVAEVDLNRVLPTVPPLPSLNRSTVEKLLKGTGPSGSPPNIPGRYGMDEKPGIANSRDAWSSYKLSGLRDYSLTAVPPGLVGLEYGTASDPHGRFAIGFRANLMDDWNPTIPVGLPSASVATSSLASEAIDSAYEFDGSGSGNNDDQPFQASELEVILRRYDIDTNVLPDRLRTLLESDFDNAANSITTSSFEVPTLFQNLPKTLSQVLTNNGVSMTDLKNEIQNMLSREVLMGLPMNVNRPFPDGITRVHANGNNYTDTRNEVLVKNDFARHLYVLTLLVTEFELNNLGDVVTRNVGVPTREYRRLVAQWAANVVDFRDNDSIMTRFEFDIEPWDGWDVGRGSPSAEIVWGAERPELLITETFASHFRRTEDTRLDSSGTRVGPGDDDDYDSRLLPNVSFSVELYNPWVTDDGNQDYNTELWKTVSGNSGVDLQKAAPDGTPVWRMIVSATDRADLRANPDDAAFDLNSKIVRRIYFNTRTPPASSTDLDFSQEAKVYFPATGLNLPPVRRGRYAVVGSYVVTDGDEHITHFGRRRVRNPLDPAELARTRRMSINPVAGTVKNYFWNDVRSEMTEETRDGVVCLPVGTTFTGLRNLGVSDPEGGYGNGLPPNVVIQGIADGAKFFNTVTMLDHAFDEPVDRLLNQAHYDTFLTNDGVQNNYRTVHLQRLANPLQPFDSETNPYRTVDSSPVDLLVFNGAEDSTNEPNINRNANPLRLGTFERNRNSATGPNPNPNPKDLFRNTFESTRPNAGTDVAGDLHFLSREFENTLGRLNEKYLTDNSTFAWLTWNNRPYASHLELANVPYQSSYRLTRSFSSEDTNVNIYGNASPLSPLDSDVGVSLLRGKHPHLLNFFSNQSRLGRVFDFVEVPSRFVGTEKFLNPDSNFAPQLDFATPDDYVSSYRYPGKVNLNTVLDPLVWHSVMREYNNSFTFANWIASRTTAPLGAIDPSSNNPISSSLFRAAGNDPFFDYSSTREDNNTARSAYFKNDGRQRLGNLVTGRSSVFAIWVTIGYFEVNPVSNQLMNANAGGVEVGYEDGKAVRHRGFYVFDRSIPVAFEPGKNHNIDQAILVRRIIE